MNGIRTCALYKTAEPEADPRAEFYSITLYTLDRFHRQPVFLREIHGWWNEETKKIIHFTKTLEPEDGFSTLEEAGDAMERQIKHRAKDGFRHLFYPTPPTDLVMYSYRLVEV